MLPVLYAAWMDDLLDGAIPPESNATCASCAMAPASNTSDVGFNPDVKCCTFHPELWNFLVGAVLLDESPENAQGRASVEARIDRGGAATPLKLGRTPAYQTLYDQTPFGQRREMLCPHYVDDQGGRCSIWRYRESTCTTWYCKFVRGAVGADFWERLHQTLRAAEEAVARWCLRELGTGDAWISWRGRERDLYRECARLVATLRWDDVRRLGGEELAEHAARTRDAHARLTSDAVVEHPVAALVQIKRRSGNRVRLATYSPMDELDLPAIITTLLPYFDGRPTATVLSTIRERERVDMDVSLVRKLTDFGVLQDRTSDQ